jgi:hypothetical protein
MRTMRDDVAQQHRPPLNNRDTGHLARALAASDNHSLTRLVEALVSSADHRATYPRQDVIAEADALL